MQALKEEGVEIDPHREDYDYGRFAWIMDPDGNRGAAEEVKLRAENCELATAFSLNSALCPRILDAP